jgi:AraC-like DNA-binding protein
MGVCFIAFPIPQRPELHNYRVSLRWLAGAFISMSVFTALLLFFNISNYSSGYVSFISVLISSVQALLFAFTLITLYNPYYAGQRRVLKHVMPIVGFIAAYAVCNVLFSDPELNTGHLSGKHFIQPTILVRLLFLGFYMFQLICYTRLFFSEEKKYRAGVNNYFSDTFSIRLMWVRYAYIAALVIGILSLLSNFFPYRDFDTILTIIFTLFYFAFSIAYIRYTNIFTIIEPAIEPQLIVIQQSNGLAKWHELKNVVITNKMYLTEGITIEQMARELKIGRTTLSGYINNEEKMNFNAWVNVLRINDSKKLLLQTPQLSIQTIARKTGFSEHANFSRQFKIVTGKSPLVWRNEQMV